jgi:hypothetical protein
MSTKAQIIDAVLTRLRGALGTGETPPGSNHNFITVWYNDSVDKIGDQPWCEETNTWAMWTGGAKALKVGRAYTVYAAQDAVKGARGSSWHWGTAGMMAGDQVYYDWSARKGDVTLVDHTGTVEKIVGDGTFYVLEGNTGDSLKRQHRDGKYVVGYVRFAWDKLVTTVPDKPDAGHLAVDGQLGPATIRLWQEIMGTPIDGVISEGVNGSELVKAVQRRLVAASGRSLRIDGFGIKQDGKQYETVAALQRYLGTTVDHRLSVPTSECVRALQRRLNTGKF